MDRSWSAEFVVAADRARSLIEAQFPRLAPATVVPIGVGWDNTAFRVNEDLVFRFPRREVAAPLIETEARVLPALAPRLPLPIPVPTFLGRPTDDYPWSFAGHAIVAGRTACAAAFDDGRRSALAAPLAAFLASLHAFPPEEAARLGVGPDAIRRLDLGFRLPKAREALDRLARLGLVADPRPYADILDAAPAAYEPRSGTLVHGDLYARHLLVDGGGGLAGVIDWGDVHLGDPAVDLAIAHTFLPPTAHAAFRRAYGTIDAPTWQVARLRALWHTLMVLAYGDHIGDADLVREGRVALRNLVIDRGCA
jgi:aminoglycoside phosphotransferase (APT) family kinase protein